MTKMLEWSFRRDHSCEKLPVHYCWNHFVSWHSVDRSYYLEMTGVEKNITQETADSRTVSQLAQECPQSATNCTSLL